MKAFTSLMKILIAVVSIALAVMLVMEAAPLVMGGVNVEEKEPVVINLNMTNLEITGKYAVTSELKQDISNLKVTVILVSQDGQNTLELANVGPVTIDSEHPNVDVVINAVIPIAELAIFTISDNMGSATPGIYLPLNIAVSGSYNNNMAGIHMDMTYNVPLSDTGSITRGAYHTDADGKVTEAEVTISGIEERLSDLIPDSGASFNVSFGGHQLNLDISKDGSGNLGAILGGGASGDVAIVDELQAILEEMLNEESEETITFTFNGVPTTFRPCDILSDDPALREKAENCIPQIEGICGSLGMFLEKFIAEA